MPFGGRGPYLLDVKKVQLSSEPLYAAGVPSATGGDDSAPVSSSSDGLVVRSGPTLRLAVLGRRITAQLAEYGAPGEPVDVAVREPLAAAFDSALSGGGFDVLLVELAELGDLPELRLEELRERSGAALAVVLYDYATRVELAQLAGARVRLAPAPLAVEELLELVQDAYYARIGRQRQFPVRGNSSVIPVPRRIFDDEALSRYAEVVSTVECECPKHLAAIVAKLVAFEHYSARCESESSADEEVHASLHVETARARAVMEAALLKVLRHDGIVH